MYHYHSTCVRECPSGQSQPFKCVVIVCIPFDELRDMRYQSVVDALGDHALCTCNGTFQAEGTETNSCVDTADDRTEGDAYKAEPAPSFALGPFQFSLEDLFVSQARANMTCLPAHPSAFTFRMTSANLSMEMGWWLRENSSGADRLSSTHSPNADSKVCTLREWRVVVIFLYSSASGRL